MTKWIPDLAYDQSTISCHPIVFLVHLPYFFDNRILYSEVLLEISRIKQYKFFCNQIFKNTVVGITIFSYSFSELSVVNANISEFFS